jgi:GNAT superfamily N-acetyltransferase
MRKQAREKVGAGQVRQSGGAGAVMAGSPAQASVRPAVPADATAIGSVQVRAWRQAYRGLLPDKALDQLSAERSADAWRSAIIAPPSPRHRVLVACASDLVVGFAAVAPRRDRDAAEHDGELVELLVDPAHQGAGHGSRLLAAATDVLRESGVTTIAAWAPTADEPRRAFLASAGLQADGARRTLAAADGTQAEQVRLIASLGRP